MASVKKGIIESSSFAEARRVQQGQLPLQLKSVGSSYTLLTFLFRRRLVGEGRCGCVPLDKAGRHWSEVDGDAEVARSDTAQCGQSPTQGMARLGEVEPVPAIRVWLIVPERRANLDLGSERSWARGCCFFPQSAPDR